MPELISGATRRARKAHRCTACDVVAIQPGDTYLREVYRGDGHPYSWVLCNGCESMTQDVWDWCFPPDNDGIVGDDYAEWASEYPDDPRAAAFLERTGSGDRP